MFLKQKQFPWQKVGLTQNKNSVVVSNIFYFHPYLGKIPILTNIFQMGWIHQLENHFVLPQKMLQKQPKMWNEAQELPFENLSVLRDDWISLVSWRRNICRVSAVSSRIFGKMWWMNGIREKITSRMVRLFFLLCQWCCVPWCCIIFLYIYTYIYTQMSKERIATPFPGAWTYPFFDAKWGFQTWPKT